MSQWRRPNAGAPEPVSRTPPCVDASFDRHGRSPENFFLRPNRFPGTGRFLGWTIEDRSDKGKPAERRGRKATGLPPLRDTAAGPPKAPEWVGVCSPHPLRIEGVPMPLRPQDGEIDVSRYAFGACSGQGVTVRLFGCGDALGLFASFDTPRRIQSASTGEVGRSHTPPTPDPAPCDSSPRTCVRTASERSDVVSKSRPRRLDDVAGSS